MSKITFNFSKSWVGFDNDETGLKAMDDLSSFGFVPVIVPLEYLKEGIKDFSDVAKYKGLEEVENILVQQGVL